MSQVSEHYFPAKETPPVVWFVDTKPNGDGTFMVRLKRPCQWISVKQAVQLIGGTASDIHTLIEDGKLDWRWQGRSGQGGRKLVLVDSLQTFVEKTVIKARV